MNSWPPAIKADALTARPPRRLSHGHDTVPIVVSVMTRQMVSGRDVALHAEVRLPLAGYVSMVRSLGVTASTFINYHVSVCLGY